MSVVVMWLGHAAWMVKTDKHLILIDPFLNDSPSAPLKAKDVDPDFILLSHGHFDHVGDTIEIAQRTGAPVITNFEISVWLEKQGVKNVVGGNLGGWAKQPFGEVKFTPAVHSSSLPDGTYGGNPQGFLIRTGGKTLYFACDTALFSDLQLIGAESARLGGLDLAVVPIGDLYTMGPEDALQAIQWLRPKHALPTHYDTWPPIAQDGKAWAERVTRETSSKGHAPKPGEALTIE